MTYQGHALGSDLALSVEREGLLIEGEAAETCMGMIQRDSNIRLRSYETGVGAVQEFVPAR